jgi:hypothetical protein
MARYARQHNGANVLSLGATLIQPKDALDVVNVWLNTPMTEARYIRRPCEDPGAGNQRQTVNVMQWADLQRIIAEEVAAALARGRTRTCDCHSVLYDCCPDRVRGVIGAGASRLGLYAGEKVPSDVAALIDHTLLKADATRQEIDKLCREAREFGFATVCVNPTWVSLCAQLLRGSSAGVCTGGRVSTGRHDPRRQAIRNT